MWTVNNIISSWNIYIVLYRWKTVYTRPNTLVAVSGESVVQQPLPLSKMDFVLVGRMPGKPVICQWYRKYLECWKNTQMLKWFCFINTVAKQLQWKSTQLHFLFSFFVCFLLSERFSEAFWLVLVTTLVYQVGSHTSKAEIPS